MFRRKSDGAASRGDGSGNGTGAEPASDSIITLDDHGTLTSVNPAGERMLGYGADELVGRSLGDVVPDADGGDRDGDGARNGAAGLSAILGRAREVNALRKDGSALPIELTVNEIRLDDRTLFVGIAKDITGRKRSERRLAESAAMQQAILDSTNYAIMSTSLDGTIRSFNRAAEQILGYTADEVVGKTTPAFVHDPKELEHRAQVLTRELETTVKPGFQVLAARAFMGNADESEWTYVRKDGSRLPVLLSVTPLRDPEGEVSGFVVIGQDITERKKIDRMKDEFISTVSHELRTPLTAIIGSLGLIRNGAAGDFSEKGRSMIDIAYNNSDRLLRLINDILDIEKIESGEMEFHKEILDIQKLVEEAVRINMAYSEQYGVRFDIRERLPGALVEADGDKLMQVLTNLLSNAAKFSRPKSDVTIDVTRQEGTVRVTVADRGPGIPADFQSRIFQKFAQADSSDTRQKGGTGLGLSISKAIIEKHDGRIWFETRRRKGTAFHFELAERKSPSARDRPATEDAHV